MKIKMYKCDMCDCVIVNYDNLPFNALICECIMVGKEWGKKHWRQIS